MNASASPSSRAWSIERVLVHAILIFFVIVVLAPFAWLVCAALKSNQEFFLSAFLPRGDGFLGIAWNRLTLEHFARLFTQLAVGRSLLNSVFLASCTAILATLTSAMGGYALARLDFRGRKAITTLVLAAVLIPGPLLLAPGYQLLYNLGLLDSLWALILPAATPAFGVFLFRQASLSSVPVQLIEAARMDGASETRIFFRVALPLLRPMVGTFILITFVGTWNNYIGPQVVLQSSDKFPLALSIANLRGVFYQDYGLQMAGTVVSILPVLILVVLLQRDFIAGLTAGAVKG